MNEAEKAKALLTSKKINLSRISRKLDLPLVTLQRYRHNPKDLELAMWKRVHMFARLYDVMHKQGLL